MDSNSDSHISHKILSLLCDSSIINELPYYRNLIQQDLQLSDDTMDRLYNLSNICKLLKPTPPIQRFYKGKLITSNKCSCSLCKYGCRCWQCSN